ncbi:peroxide stress protein YaaA, partial [Lactobacillus sp. XV13L]|nr:peroxide stress protein YaaA [Lactobacillus sp. XV13L]
LEMKNKAAGFREPNLYKFWGSRLADNLFSEDNVVVNLASKEYSQSIAPYATGSRQLLNVIFQEEKNGQWKTVGVHAKMARGEMTRFIAERGLTAPEQLQDFNDFGFEYDSAVSTPSAYVFRTKFDFKRR